MSYQPPAVLKFPELMGAASRFEEVNRSDHYEEKYYFTSQLFDPDWLPRDTLEHSPTAERS